MQMIVPYAEAAAVMLANLDHGRIGMVGQHHSGSRLTR